MRLIDADDLKKKLQSRRNSSEEDFDRGFDLGIGVAMNLIHNAPTIGETEKPFITECRDMAIEKNLPLYFVYYEETGVFEVYITATQELFEKRHCSKHLSYSEFDDIATIYLDCYLDWKGGME